MIRKISAMNAKIHIKLFIDVPSIYIFSNNLVDYEVNVQEHLRKSKKLNEL